MELETVRQVHIELETVRQVHIEIETVGQFKVISVYDYFVTEIIGLNFQTVGKGH